LVMGPRRIREKQRWVGRRAKSDTRTAEREGEERRRRCHAAKRLRRDRTESTSEKEGASKHAATNH
jgi:hypothetical protein